MNISPNEIDEFYNESRGRMVRRLMRVLINDWWPEISGEHVMGYGYPMPFMSLFKKHNTLSETILMNRNYAPRPWPKPERNFLAVCEDTHLPIETQRMNRILVMHALENSSDPTALLQELWRVLDGNGRMILVVPNRAGVWSRAEHTPFGHGHPYSYTQLKHSLEQAGFTIERYQRALYVPATRSRLMIYSAPLIERMGRRLCKAFGGLLMVEVSKQLFAVNPVNGNKSSVTSGLIPKAVKTNAKL